MTLAIQTAMILFAVLVAMLVPLIITYVQLQ